MGVDALVAGHANRSPWRRRRRVNVAPLQQPSPNRPTVVAFRPMEQQYVSMRATAEPTVQTVYQPPQPAPLLENCAATQAQQQHSTTAESGGSVGCLSWTSCRNLVGADSLGTPIRQPRSRWPVVKVQVCLLSPLLYNVEACRWMWHKKWSLPKIHVRVFLDDIPVGGGFTVAHETPVHVIVTAGTLGDSGELQDAGLEGDNEQMLIDGESYFSSLRFMNTSFNCGSRPFHLVVSAVAPPHHPIAAVAAMASDEGTQITGDLSRPKVALACVLSEPILVDSRKRTQRERPRAKSSNVRLVHRQPGQAANSGLPLGVPPRASFSTESAHACSIGQTPQAWTLGDINPPAAPPPQHVQLLAGAGGEPILDACPGTRTMGITNDTMATTSQSSAPSSPLPPSQSFTEDKNDFYDGIGDGTVELNNALVITQVFGHTAFGYTPNELTGVSILTILPADDHQLFIQTAKVLLEFNEAPLQDLQVPLSQTLPSVRALHRVIYQCPDDTGAAEEIMDSAISVIRQTRPGEANTLLVSSRCADLLAIGPEGSSGSALFRIL